MGLLTRDASEVLKQKLSTTSELAVGRGRGRVRRAAAAPWATTGGEVLMMMVAGNSVV